ncbi:hypothetical protein NQ315_007308 [Exocentrus adspersus]|uniref:Uncharacterized protein n=1 Tax=Exocentrus adspersus TaxID=1586481 RepID=A0AAV8WEE2_9CUCU|nr:hypothetical protein NQ315_007308 [Exocentrus adspersus]
MLELQYQPRHGMVRSECWPYSKYIPVDIPDYKINKPLDYYDRWPSYYYMYLPIPEYRRYLNNLLLRDLRKMTTYENRWDPILGTSYTYFPDSKYFRNYRFSPPISWWDDWSYRSRIWFPYYWSTRRLFNHYMDYQPSLHAIREQRLRNNLYF